MNRSVDVATPHYNGTLKRPRTVATAGGMTGSPQEAPMSENDTPTTLYRLFDQTGVLLYVGIAGNPGRRWEQHRADKPWWGDVATTRLEHFPTREAALSAELDAIRSENPRHNVVGKNQQSTRGFTRWLSRQRDRNDPVGDFARDVKHDQAWPYPKSSHALENYLCSYGLYEGDAGFAAGMRAWGEYLQHNGPRVNPHTVRYDFPPHVHATAVSGRMWQITCPFCDEKHTHGGEPGRRVAHCGGTTAEQHPDVDLGYFLSGVGGQITCGATLEMYPDACPRCMERRGELHDTTPQMATLIGEGLTARYECGSCGCWWECWWAWRDEWTDSSAGVAA